MTMSSDPPRSFRHLRLLLARKRNHPFGDTEEGYDLLVPRYFDYQEEDRDDEEGFRLGDEMFVTGEYVSIVHRDGTRVALP